MQPGFYVDRMTDQQPTLKYDHGQPDWEDLRRSTGGLVGLIQLNALYGVLRLIQKNQPLQAGVGPETLEMAPQ